MIKRLLLRSIPVFFIVIILFLALEFLFRFYRGKDLKLGLTMGRPVKKYSHDFEPNKEFRLKSSKKYEFDVMVRINNFGFRGKDIKLEKDPGTVRILMIGDSFTFGVGAENDETIPYLFEQNLKRRGINAEVINAGVGHSSPILYYLKLRDFYLKFKPDVAILLFDFSDLRDDWNTERQAIYSKDGELLYTDPTMVHGKKDWWGVIRRNSEVCKYIHNKVIRTARKIEVLGLKNYIKVKLQGKRAKAVIVNSLEAGRKIDTIEYDGYLLMRGREKKDDIERHWKLTAKYLLKVRDTLAEHGIDFALVMYPYGIHVGPDEWGEGRVYWGFEPNKIYTDRYSFDIIERFAQKNNVYCINTLDDFLKNKRPGEMLFFHLDGYLTPAGNGIVADSLAKDEVLINMIER